MRRTIGTENPNQFNNRGGPAALIYVKYSGSGVIFKGGRTQLAASRPASGEPRNGPETTGCACSSRRSTLKSSSRMNSRLFHGNYGCPRPNMRRINIFKVTFPSRCPGNSHYSTRNDCIRSIYLNGRADSSETCIILSMSSGGAFFKRSVLSLSPDRARARHDGRRSSREAL